MSEFKRPGTPPGFAPPEHQTDLDRNVTPVETPKAPAPPLAAPPRPKGATGMVAAVPPAPPPEDVTHGRAATQYAGPDRRSGPAPQYPGPDRRTLPAAGPPPAPERRMATQQRRALEPSAPPAQRSFWPSQPRTIEEAGLNVAMVEELILKAVFFAGEMRGMDIANRLRLPSAIVDEVIEGLRRQKYLDIRGGGSSGVGRSTMIYQLTSFATELMRQILDRNRYNGPAPIPIQDWVYAVRKQTVRGNRITRARMEDKFGDLSIRDYIFDGIGPAMNSGRAIFFYGPPGNGKTAICQCMVNCFEGDIFIPYAIMIDDFIVRVYDDILHKAVEDEPGAATYDRRWVRIKRPLVVVGGELTLEMLDLVYSPEVKYYEASFQMKAMNGMLLIDDFGRQKASPVDILNRWIVPLESDVDNITLHTGKKVQVPFDVFAAFSTNLDPSDLVDDAFLRRVRYKLEVQRPDENQFFEIFEIMCRKRGVPYDPDMVEYLVEKHYRSVGRLFAACQPRDLLDQVIDMANYLGIPPQLNPVLLDRAVRSYFVRFDKDTSERTTMASVGKAP
ncbi:ATPase [Hyalangium minutum]|uniref:Putative ATPase n=1 Tax=Hyalangium minutum TaxID=394096 RepID=A0A085WS65_9BACT|nr:ATPase [Hyalangium minutum]KFE70528.1 putative ATPase [Hyalangium minutum]